MAVGAKKVKTARSRRHRRFAVVAASGVALAMVPSTTFAEPMIGTGESAEGTYVAVATTGSAGSSQGVAVSGTGSAYSGPGGVGVSVFGRANGSGTNISGEAYFAHTGLLQGPVDAEQALVPTTDPGNPADLPVKLQATAENAPWVALNMATGLLEAPSSSSASQNSTMSAAPPRERVVMMTMYAQERWYYCVPASLQMYLNAHGTWNTSQSGWASALKTKAPSSQRPNDDPTAGTPLNNAVSFINRYKGHSDSVFWTEMYGAKELMDKLTTDVYNYGHSMILSVRPISGLSAWQQARKGEDSHAVVAHGYHHQSGGSIDIMDPYDYTRFNWDYNSWGGPNPGGSHRETLAGVWSATEADGGWSIW